MTSQASYFEKKYGKYLQQQTVELILLKGHLLIEQVINENLLRHIQNEEHFNKLRLKFSQKLNLLIALRGVKEYRDVLESLKKLNSIRNKLAHHLNFDDYHQDLKDWCASVHPIFKRHPTNEEEYKKLLRSTLAFLLGILESTNENLTIK